MMTFASKKSYHTGYCYTAAATTSALQCMKMDTAALAVSVLIVPLRITDA